VSATGADSAWWARVPDRVVDAGAFRSGPTPDGGYEAGLRIPADSAR
jgi:hypothetical protein